MSTHFSCNSFRQIPWVEYQQNLHQAVRNEVHDRPKEYILGVDENEYKSYLVQQYTLQPLEIVANSEHIATPRTEKEQFRDALDRICYRDVYVFRVRHNFTGSPGLFEVQPNPAMSTTYPINVESGTVSLEVSVPNKDAAEFKRRKEQAFQNSFVNVGSINNNVSEWNKALPNWVNQVFDARKKHFADENNFFAAVNVAPDPGTSAIFTAPTIKRRVIPQPKISEKTQFSRVPTMSDEMYEDVLTVLSQAGHGMERKPSLYRDKEEEDLRDQFLLFLETRYTATTGTGETFNKAGKTDILLKYQDGSNLFVTECKWWSGEADFHAAIEQLFARYLTWRDSKAALLLFVNNKNFSAVLEKVRNEAAKNAYFVCRMTDRSETSLSFDFHLPDDEERIVKLAILLFAFR